MALIKDIKCRTPFGEGPAPKLLKSAERRWLVADVLRHIFDKESENDFLAINDATYTFGKLPRAFLSPITRGLAFPFYLLKIEFQTVHNSIRSNHLIPP
jgi:hypothetical protein